MGIDPGSVTPVSGQAVTVASNVTGQNAAEVNGSTQISSIADLQKKAPQVFDALVMSIAMQIRSQQEASMRRFKEAQRKMRE